MKIRTGIGFWVFLIYLAFDGYKYVDFMIFPAIIVHELGHILAARFSKTKISGISIEPFGARIELEGGIVSYTQELIVSAMGPVFSIVFAILSFLLAKENFVNASFFDFSAYSLFLGALNLFPMKTFDGGRILSSLLSVRFGIKTAENAIEITTFLAAFFMWFISVYILLKYRAGLSLFVVSLFSLLRFALP